MRRRTGCGEETWRAWSRLTAGVRARRARVCSDSRGGSFALARGHRVGPSARRGACCAVPCLIHHSSQPRSRTDAGFVAARWVGLGFSIAFSRAATAACSSCFSFISIRVRVGGGRAIGCANNGGRQYCSISISAHHQIKLVQGHLQQCCKNAALLKIDTSISNSRCQKNYRTVRSSLPGRCKIRRWQTIFFNIHTP
jgi:hypothetical protein